MKFTILGHASMVVEGEGRSLVVDPWLVGSCYWRSWWNFPEPSDELVRSLRPDFIYLTHLHWDHFHGPSLARFDRATRILVPRVPTTRMLRDLASLGFHHVEEIPHGGSVELWPGCRLHSFQFGAFFTDSAMVVSDGRTTLLNLNDCKLFGWPLAQVKRRFPRIDFVFRSHSSAGPLPYCVEGWSEGVGGTRTPDDYAQEFARFALSIGASHAVPFASNHCFLHRETKKFNDLATHPGRVAATCERLAREVGRESPCVVMPPGSSWSADEGFRLQLFDYSRKQEYVAQLEAKYLAKLEGQYRSEDRARASYQAFQRYFERFVAALPRLLPRSLEPRVLFEARERERSRWFLVDCAVRRVAEVESREAAGEVDVEVAVPALVLNDCVRKEMFSAWTPSKLLSIRVKGESLGPVTLFLGYLDMFEGEMLPLRANLTARALGVRLRRWREVLEAMRLLVRHRVLGRPFSAADLHPMPRSHTRGA